MVNLSTFTDDVSVFIRDVLRNNLVDTQATARAGNEWIFKSMPEKKPFNPPMVVLNVDPMTRSKGVMSNIDKSASVDISVEVWSKKIANRDDIADQVLKILRDVNSTDSGGTSLMDNELHLLGEDSRDRDVEDLEGRLMRRKFITASFVYGGK